MIRFDDVLDETVRCVEAAPLASRLQEATIIRDLRGRVRLVLKAQPKLGKADRQALAQSLAAALVARTGAVRSGSRVSGVTRRIRRPRGRYKPNGNYGLTRRRRAG